MGVSLVFSLGLTWIPLVQLVFTRSHSDPLGFTWNTREKGKSPAPKREKGKAQTLNLVRLPPYNQTARTHAQTNETKRFPGWTHPPTSDVYTHARLVCMKTGVFRRNEIWLNRYAKAVKRNASESMLFLSRLDPRRLRVQLSTLDARSTLCTYAC